MTVRLVQFSKRSSAVWSLNLKDHDGDSDIFQAYRDTAICCALWRIPTTSQLRYLMFWFSSFFKNVPSRFLKCLCIYKQSASWERCFFLQDKGSTFISQLYYNKFYVSDMTDSSPGLGDQTLKLLLYRFHCSADWSNPSVWLDTRVLQEQNSRFSSQCCKTKKTLCFILSEIESFFQKFLLLVCSVN